MFLFGTAGFGESEAYFQKVLDRVKESIDESNSIIGTYMCQGKMPMAVRERYEKMKQQPNPAPNRASSPRSTATMWSHSPARWQSNSGLDTTGEPQTTNTLQATALAYPSNASTRDRPRSP